MSKTDLVYLDNNATTRLSPDAEKEYTKWLSKSWNPSSTSKFAMPSRQVLEETRNLLKTHCDAENYTILFTSGATESNIAILNMVVDSYANIRSRIPTIITSEIEHESIIACCKRFLELKKANVVFISPTTEGSVPIHAVEKAITGNSEVALISIMLANNELGTINNVREIGTLAHKYGIPFHTDAVQAFGKYKINLNENNIDALSAAFHKFGGPVGLGLLFIKNDLIYGYELGAFIPGKQQGGLRGGTENVPAIAAGAVALQTAFTNRELKNEKMRNLRNLLIAGLAKIYPIGDFNHYVKKHLQSTVDMFAIDSDPAAEGFVGKYESSENPIEIVILGPPVEAVARTLPNTVLFSVVKSDDGEPFCNVQLKKDLDDRGVVVSIGSACQTVTNHASHVLKAIKSPNVVSRGVIRVSLGDTSTREDVTKFLSALKECISLQIQPQKKKTSAPRGLKSKSSKKT